MGYGVIANVSPSGACVWTNGRFSTGVEFKFHLSFSYPPEVHEVTGVIVWEGSGEANRDTPARRCGVEWRETPPGCAERIRELVGEAEDELLPHSWLIALRRAREGH
jgi:hypothetical protein